MDSAGCSCNHAACKMVEMLARSWLRCLFSRVVARNAPFLSAFAICVLSCDNDPRHQPRDKSVPSETPPSPPTNSPETPSSGSNSPLLPQPLPSANHPYVGQLWASCYHGFRTSNRPHRDVTRLSLLCAPNQGMKRYGRTFFRTMREDDDAHVDVRLAVSQCARVFVVADDGPKSFRAITTGPSGQVLAFAQSTSGFAVLQPDGAFCADETGEYRTRIVIDEGAGTVAAEVWTLPGQ